ncbi:MAG: hypothetical protein ACQ9ET_03610 [Nitrosomonadaceae bacterium]
MKFRIAKPEFHIEYSKNGTIYYEDIITFYNMLPGVLDNLGIEYDILHIRKPSRKMYLQDGTIYLAYHNYGNHPNIWHIKSAYMPNYFYFDKNGYGPWSEVAKEYDFTIDSNTVRDDVNKFCKEYIDNNESRVKQPESVYGIPDEPYVLVLGQRPDDTVSKFSYIDTESLLHKVSKLYKGTKYKVCTRGHPLEAGTPYGTADDLQATGNIHKCIENAAAVYTVNSGTGFEALLHGKRVFTSGLCDYRWATTEVKDDEDLKCSIELVEEPIDDDKRVQFLHYAINHHFVNVNDPASIERKILRAVEEYEN